jgi:hypothetical protein
MAHTGPCLLLRNGSSFLDLHDGQSGLLLHGGLTASVGGGISGGTFSRGRWHKIVRAEENARQAAIDERERERKRRIEAKRKAKAEAETARKAKEKADHAALVTQIASLIGGSRADAAQAARAMTATLDKLRLDTLAADSARQRAEAQKARELPPQPKPLEMIRDLMKHIRVEDVTTRDVIENLMKLDLLSDVMKRDLVSDVMKRNKDKYGLK